MLKTLVSYVFNFVCVVHFRLTNAKENTIDCWVTLKMEANEFYRIEGNLLTKVRALYFDYLRNKKASFTNAVSKEFANITAIEIEEWFPDDRDVMTTVNEHNFILLYCVL